MNKTPLYHNKKQLEAMAIAANNEYIVASRGFGKSEGIDAPRALRNVFAMPRGSGAILSPTYAKLLQNTLPAVARAWERYGYKRNVHFYIGRKPPRNSGFKEPLINPFSYDHVVIWFNGSIQHLVSFDRSMSVNSLSLDYVLGWEAKFLDYNKIKEEVSPAIRGDIPQFRNCPWYHGQIYSTDMPTTSKGAWILEKEKEMDKELIETIKQLYLKYIELKQIKSKSAYQLNKQNKIKRALNKLRSVATFYAEYNAFDNIEILGENYIRNMKRDLPPLLFQTAILNQRMRKVANGYYSALEESIHYYEAPNYNYIDSLGYDLNKTSKVDCRHDGDLLKDQQLRIALDYNAAINSLVCGQVTEDNQLRTIKSMFVKTPRKLADVCNDWADYYQSFNNKNVIYYYDSTSIADSPTDSESLMDTVVNTLTKRGWNVEPIYIGKPIKHTLRHKYIDDGLKGAGYTFPVFNSNNCEYLLLAMEQAGIKIGRNGFEKDKTREKYADTPQDPDELKTHITDAWDQLFIGVNFFNDKQSSQGFQYATKFN